MAVTGQKIWSTPEMDSRDEHERADQLINPTPTVISIPLTRQGQVRCDLSLPPALEDSLLSMIHPFHVSKELRARPSCDVLVPSAKLWTERQQRPHEVMNSAALLIFV